MAKKAARNARSHQRPRPHKKGAVRRCEEPKVTAPTRAVLYVREHQNLGTPEIEFRVALLEEQIASVSETEQEVQKSLNELRRKLRQARADRDALAGILEGRR